MKNYLSGEAERIISHYQLTGANYIFAWRALTDMYNNIRTISNFTLSSGSDQPTIKHIKQIHDVVPEVLASLTYRSTH